MKTSKQTRATVALLTAISAGIAGCGSGGSSEGNDPGPGSGMTATGQFKDSNVSGVQFVSGAVSGVTNARGEFTYETGSSVSFSVGGVPLGSAMGKSVITPIDLMPNGASSDRRVQNIARFLQMLDLDGTPTNGIEISPAVQSAATNWSPVNFDTADLASEVSTQVDQADAADGRAHVLPTAAAAQAHLDATLRCARSGAFSGTFSGDASGTFGVFVDARTNALAGFGYVPNEQSLLVLNGVSALSTDQNAAFVFGDASSGASFSGQLTGTDQLGGNWELAPEQGTFSGSRIAVSTDPVYRFTGQFTGAAVGLVAFDVDAADRVTGVAYTVLAPIDGTTNELSPLNGSLVGSTLTINTDGTTVNAVLNKSTGVMSGSWNDEDGNTGSITGAGCRLN